MGTLALLLGLLAVATPLAAPRLLSRGTWWCRRPQLCLSAWVAACVVGSLALVGSLLTLFALALGSRGSTTSRDGVGFEVLAWVVLVTMVGLTVAALAQADGVVASSGATRDRMATLAQVTGYDAVRRGGLDVVVLRTDAVIACCSARPTPMVFVSRGLVRDLEPTELDAVIAHEAAHLQMRHALITQGLSLVAGCAPSLAASRGLRRHLAVLVELVADDRAAARVGREQLCNALAKVSRQQHSELLALRHARLATST